MIEKQPLHEFVAWWRQYCKGDEKGEAQIFLDRLFRALGHAGAMEAGGTFEERVRTQYAEKTTTAFADFVIPRRVIIEMKKRGEDLRKHYDQALDYWIDLASKRPQYVVLCNFDELWIYDLNRQPRDPMDKIKIEDLPERSNALTFLFPIPQTPVFENDRVAVTEEAAQTLATVFQSLLRPVETRKLERVDAQRFILQCMLSLFAEDIGLLPSRLFTRLIEACQEGENSYDVITNLFTAMNRSGRERVGRYYGVDYFDGGLFAQITPVDLYGQELISLRDAARHNWSKIHPGIFGTIFEQSMDKDERHRVGGHYTSEVDILRIVRPVIVRPWRERIASASTLDELSVLHDGLCRYQVLDPACGSGNFLYVAYHEMKALESEILSRIHALDTQYQPSHFVTAKQFWGFDIKSFAVELAKVTLMIAKKLAVDEFGLSEQPLPLDNLDTNIREADALFEPWPEFDACIGNPPYLGARKLKTERGVAYANKVRAIFSGVPGNADYCVYWFRKAHDLMKDGARAGLVGTKNISKNEARVGGLDHIVQDNGYIFEAVSSIPWSGEAAVSVSIACWSKGQPPFKPARLWVNNGGNVLEVPLISSSLSPKTDVKKAKVLRVNKHPKRVFQGQIPGHEAFILTTNEAREMVRRDSSSRQVIYPFLIGRDLTAQPGGKPSRFVIDLNAYDVVTVQQFQEAYKHVKTHVLQVREAKAEEEEIRNKQALFADPNAPLDQDSKNTLSQWWKHHRGRSDMLTAIAKLSRYIVCSGVTKRPIFDFVSPNVRPDHSLFVFAFNDDYSYGIIQSVIHWEWFIEKGSALTDRPRYTPNTVYDTFPWPQNPKSGQVKAVADAARALHEYRRNVMATKEEITLRRMYRSLETPGKNPLKDLHTTLDKAVMDAYGFDSKGDLLAQLLALNESVAARINAGEPVTAPGIPPDYPNPAELVSEGCITPPELI
jgi:methylase of polypeptide subunit release factors